MQKQALAGVRVLEISQYIAGPLLGRMMVDMGAEVVKLELAPIGDLTRAPQTARGGGAADAHAAAYVYWNRGKRSIGLDIKRPEAAAIARELVPHFDVLIENYTPGVLAKYGFSYDALREVNPRLIMCSISGYGQTGPMAHLPGNDTVAQAMAGMFHLNGNPDGSPVYPGAYIADATGGINGLSAVLAALYYREKSGVGQYIDLALVECLFHLHDVPLVMYLFSNGAVNMTRCGPHRDDYAPCGIFKAPDGYLVLTVLFHQWAQFTELIGHPELARDPRFSDVPARCRHKLELAAIIEEWLQTHGSRDESVKFLQDHHFLCAPVLNLDEVMNHPQFKSRETLQRLEVPGFGQVPLPRTPFHFSETPVEIPNHLALLGQDNESVLGDYLSYSKDKVEKLTGRGLLVRDPRLAQ
jgi:crotonobetainyl-CoA:carnitine CoA-transferase CaiB-like acyl-CoA transferase